MSVVPPEGPPLPRVDLIDATSSSAPPDAAPPSAAGFAEATPSLPTDESPPAPRPRLNALAVAALVLAILFSPSAALFGHIAASQIGRSERRERGAVIAWVAVGLGYVWLLAAIVIAVALWLFFTS